MNKFDEAIKILNDLREYDNGDNTFLTITLGEITSVDKALELGKELENENMMLKTKLAMYKELDEIMINIMGEITLEEAVELDIKQQDLRTKIKSLDKKCDGECGI